jgi:hypothetical protein
MKKITLLLSIMAACFSLSAQEEPDFEVPTDPVLVKTEDYAPYEKDIITAAKWLEAVPIDKQLPKRKDASAFVVKWILGSPTVTVTLYSTVSDFDKKNKGFLVLYMAAAARYVLENNYSKDEKETTRQGLKALIRVYKKEGSGVSKDKKMEKLVKADDEGKLDEWMKDNLK